MEPITLLLRLPILPVQGVIRLAELIQDEAERQLHDPTRIRHELEEAERRHATGEISDDERASLEHEATARLGVTVIPGATVDPREGS